MSRPFGAIEWVGFFRVGSEEKARRIVDRVAARVDQAMTVDVVEQYWKDRGLYRVHFRSTLEEVDPAQAVFTLMNRFCRVAHGCSTSGPQQYEQGWEFEVGSSAGFSVAGVEMLTARISNVEVGAGTPVDSEGDLRSTGSSSRFIPAPSGPKATRWPST